MNMERWDDMQGKAKETWRKTCSCASSSTMNPMWSHLGLKPRLCGDKPPSNCLSYGMASSVICRVNNIQNVTIISRYQLVSLHCIVTLHLYRCKNLILISLFIMRLNTENHSCNLLNKFNSDPYWSICYETPNWDFMSVYINLCAI
jgi:hypothetical protein